MAIPVTFVLAYELGRGWGNNYSMETGQKGNPKMTSSGGDGELRGYKYVQLGKGMIVLGYSFNTYSYSIGILRE